jgi:lipopolysaccharide export system ATP-binding protein
LTQNVFDDLLTLFRRRRTLGRERQPAATDGRWRMDLPLMGGPIALGRSDRMPRAEQRMQSRQQRDSSGAALRAPQPSQQFGGDTGWRGPQPLQEFDDTEWRAPDLLHREDGVGWQVSQSSPQAAQQSYLAAHAVEKSFGSNMVVKGASLYVRRGEAVGLLGPNGAGKTTIFYMITGLIKADRGRIELDGHDVTGLPMYQRARLGIGYLPQEASIFRGLNVEDNIRAVLEVVEPNRKRRERDLDALLEEFDITRVRKTPSIALSGGERRRVEIARALATRPNYMLLDEPFAGIDPIAVGDLQSLVRHLTNRGIGVLITDHNVRETLGLTDRAYIIYSGEVLMEGRTDDIISNPEVRRLYLGEGFRL